MDPEGNMLSEASQTEKTTAMITLICGKRTKLPVGRGKVQDRESPTDSFMYEISDIDILHSTWNITNIL